MAAIITNKETVLEYVRINFINDNSSLPDFERAAQRYLVPIIGQDLYDALADDFESDPPLLAKCRAVVAPLAYLMDLPIIHAQITDSGLKTASTENLQAAHRWEYNKIEEHLADKGAFAIEDLLKYLFANEAANLLWTDSEEYAEATSLIFKTAGEFNKYFRVYQPYRTFWALRAMILEAEDQYISSTIGEDFFTELKELDVPDANEKKAITLLKKATAQLAIVKAIEKLSVIITEKGFTVQLTAGNADAANAGDASAKDNQLSLLYSSCEKDGNNYLVKLQEFLNATASAALFTTYFNSEFYTAPPDEEPESRNANSKIFGL